MQEVFRPKLYTSIGKHARSPRLSRTIVRPRVLTGHRGFLSHGGTPSYHPFTSGIFPFKPSIHPQFSGNPHIWVCSFTVPLILFTVNPCQSPILDEAIEFLHRTLASFIENTIDKSIEIIELYRIIDI